MSEKIKQDISIGKNLHRLRKQAGLSQEQVAVKLPFFFLPSLQNCFIDKPV